MWFYTLLALLVNNSGNHQQESSTHRIMSPLKVEYNGTNTKYVAFVHGVKIRFARFSQVLEKVLNLWHCTKTHARAKRF